MVKTAYLKSLGRLFIRHIIRLLSISAIFVVTVSLISGLGDVQGNIKKSINASYIQDNVHDVTVRSYTDVVGRIKRWIIDNPTHYSEIKDIDTVYTYDTRDMENERYSKRSVFMNFNDYAKRSDATDRLELLEGRFPDPSKTKQDEFEVVVERSTKDIVTHELGEKISIKIANQAISPYTFTAKVVGIVKNPTMVSLTREPSIYIIGGKDHIYLNDVFYLPDTLLTTSGTGLEPLSAFPSLSITIKDRNIFNTFSDAYNDAVTILKTKISNIPFVGDLSIVYSLADDNYSLWTLNLYADKVGVLATIFIVFFILIAILVVYSTMSRLLDEERGAMAVLKTLGYSNFAIAFRYLLFAFIAGGIGIGLSVFPAKIVNSLILNAFGIQYAMKSIVLPIVGPFFAILALTILVLSLILTTIKSVRTANHSPVELLTPRAPKVGKKILLERIKAIWSRLSFKYKSTYRNVFLFKARFVMTVLSIMAATVMVFASFALLNNATKMQGFDSLQMISILLLAFSAALCALVIYNITNINISERTREIATLMVLGYRNHEVTGYIYREIYILTAIGAILGLPAGIGFIVFVFDYIGVFQLSNVEWWTYLVSPILTFVFALLATRLLHMKIVKTDMNESLKVLE